VTHFRSRRITYTQEWDVENKLVAVTNTVAGQVTRFYRDADGALVKKSDGADTVMVVNGVYEEAGGVATSYYMFGGQRPSTGSGTVAMRVAGAVYWLHGDHPSTSSGYHLGSASLTTNVSGQKACPERSRRGSRVALSAVWSNAVDERDDANRPAFHRAARSAGDRAV